MSGEDVNLDLGFFSELSKAKGKVAIVETPHAGRGLAGRVAFRPGVYCWQHVCRFVVRSVSKAPTRVSQARYL
jgi:hypothetical protein